MRSSLLMSVCVISLLMYGSGCGGGSDSGSTTTYPPTPTSSFAACGGATNIGCASTREVCILEQSGNCGTPGELGQCIVRPALSGCSTMANQVCGCNGRTYLNTCEATYYGISVESQGACPEDTTPRLDCRDDSTWPEAWKEKEKEILAGVNRHRADGGTCRGVYFPPVGPLVTNSQLLEASRCHSLDMGVRGYFSHGTPEGRSFIDRMQTAGYTANPKGEIIAGGYATTGGVVNGWMGSSTGHCEIVMLGSANEVGIGYAYVERSPLRHYVTGEFGYRP